MAKTLLLRVHSRFKGSMLLLLMLVVLIQHVEGQGLDDIVCGPGWDKQGSPPYCRLCNGGNYCAYQSSTQQNCNAGNYCRAGLRVQCPKGYYCPGSNAQSPTQCNHESKQYSGAGASSCSTGSTAQYTPSPDTVKTCTAAVWNNQFCPECPAGNRCTGGTTNSCSGTTGAKTYQANTFGGSCQTAAAGTFAASSLWDQEACPPGKWAAASKTSCSWAGVNKKTNANQQGTTNCNTPQEQSANEASVCVNAPVGYWGASVSGSTINFKPLPPGTFKPNVGDANYQDCPINFKCDHTSKTACEPEKASYNLQSYCTRMPIGYYKDSGSSTGYSACTGNNKAYNLVTQTCAACSWMKCSQFTGLTQTCPVGYYLSSQYAYSCTKCQAGYYCATDIGNANKRDRKTIPNGQRPAPRTGTPDNKYQCPAGYYCSASTITMNTDRYTCIYGCFSQIQNNYFTSRDLTGYTCPDNTYYTAADNGYKCQPSDKGQQRSGGNNSQDQCQAASNYAWVGEKCSSIKTDYHSDWAWMFDVEESLTQHVHCPTGWWSITTTGSPADQKCSQAGPWAFYAAHAPRGFGTQCQVGEVSIGHSTSFIPTDNKVTHYINMRDSNENSLCIDCAPNMACLTSGQTVNPYESSNSAPDSNNPSFLRSFVTYCVGKDPRIKWYDANNSNKLIHMDDRRVAQPTNKYCIDCNHEEFAAGSCAFVADYFPDHYRTAATNNNPLTNGVVKCPFQTLSRTQTRYLDEIQWKRQDGRDTGMNDVTKEWSRHDLNSVGHEYTTYGWFEDEEENKYPYSFCNIDETYYTEHQITSHSEFNDPTEKVKTECTLYEYFTPNFPRCEPAFGGFVSPTNQNQPTEKAVPDGYLTQPFHNDDYTGLKLMQCPEHTSPLMVEGGTNQYHACHISDLGICKDATSDYCMGGQDYMCPDGFNKKASGPYNNDINDCESCGSGQVCSASTASTTCPDGYNCEAMTSDVYSKPGQPGELLTADGSGQNTIATCTGGYCEGATSPSTLKQCPAGYFNNYSGASASGQHSAAGCSPTPGGTHGSSQTACAAGKFCPPGSKDDTLLTPAGFYKATGNVGSINDLTVCPAGSWCAAGSTASTTQCDTGYYCEAGTVFQYDTPCSFGQTSTAGNSALSSCSSCTNGNYCQQGLTTPLSDGSYCGNDNYLCIGGDLGRTECSTGQVTTDGATCAACPAGKFCTPGLAATDCSAGYESPGSLSQCTLSTPGQVTTGGAATADATAGKWTIAGQTNEFDCPPGYWCASGVITKCANGEVCAQGSSSAATASAGTVQDEQGLFYEKPCPAGQYCAAGVAMASVTAGYYSAQGTDALSTFCDSGYSCPAGAIGAMNQPCPDGKHYVTGVASDVCPDCADGSYCFQAQQIACEAGHFCDLANSPAWHQTCPIGTYSTTGANSAACTECTGGYACNQKGITTDPAAGGDNSYKIAQGYFAITGGTSTQPERIPGAGTGTYDDSYQCNPYIYDPDQTPGDLASLDMGGALGSCHQGICPKGHYCPEGTAWPVVCPLGTYNFNVGETSVDGCTKCIEGYYCPNSQEIIKCSGGDVCPEGSSDTNTKAAAGKYTLDQYPTDIVCFFGSYQTLTGQNTCPTCDAGSQCDAVGLPAVVTCDKGSDCSLAGTIVPMQCDYGMYLDPSNAVNPNCVPCPEDHYCWENAVIQSEVTADNGSRATSPGLKTYGKCPSGFKCVQGANIMGVNHEFATNADHYMCREGYYCDNTQTPVEQACAAGTFMPYQGAKVVGDCIACKPGYECRNTNTETPTDCPTGMYCAASTTTSITQCTAGHYCPTNAEKEFLCPPGTFAAAAGQTSCPNTAAGNYQEAEGQTAEKPCDIGYYCEAGQVLQQACPEGKTSVAQTQTLDDCTDEVAGKFRLGPNTLDNGIIMDGYYSFAGEKFNPPTLKGKPCEVGNFCTLGVKTPCVAGTYCEYEKEHQNIEPCDAGYYCEAGTQRRRPTELSSHKGAMCLPQQFCIQGASAGQDCPAGTYSDARGLQAQAQCTLCKNGYYCDVPKLDKATMLTKKCPAGQYCLTGTAGSDTTSAPVCETGKKCPLGSQEMIPCEPGYYQDETQKASCKECESTNFCPWMPTVDPAIGYQKYACELGHVCQDNKLSAPTPCQAGYYTDQLSQTVCLTCVAGKYCPLMATGDLTALDCPDQFYCPTGTDIPILCDDGQVCEAAVTDSQKQITKCPAGYYCVKGIRHPCFAGYLCKEGATTPTPSDGATGNLCSAGYYCEPDAATGSGPIQETGCGVGYYQPNQGASAQSNCLLCPSGTQCAGNANAAYVNVNCPDGHICDYSRDLNPIPCFVGMKCPTGTKVMITCPDGQYQPNTGKTTCEQCPAGYYCKVTYASQFDAVSGYPVEFDGPGASANLIQQGVSVPTKCPDGFYCPIGTGNYGIYRCPKGTYHDTSTTAGAQGLTDASECTPCDEKFYCPQVQMVDKASFTTDFPCADGYLCKAGSSQAQGSSTCPQNYYCIAGTATPCKPGTYSTYAGLRSQAECQNCPPGFVCEIDANGVFQNIVDCKAGQYCPGGITDHADSAKCGVDPTAICATYCPKGHYCLKKQWQPDKCEPGTYQDLEGQDSCKICPAGSYCKDSGLEAHTLCTASFQHHWCPIGTIYPQKCEIGQTVSADTTTCEPCPLGKYCWPAALNNPSYDSSGTTTDCHIDDGYLCRSGAFSPRPMVDGLAFIQPGSNLFSTYNGPVKGGYLADKTVTSGADPLVKKCDEGTWQPSILATECIDCYDGHYCPNKGMDNIDNYWCAAGFYCLKGNTQEEPPQDTKYLTGKLSYVDDGGLTDVNKIIGGPCPLNKQCPFIHVHQMECADGFISLETGLAQCNACSTGHYCDMHEDQTKEIQCVTQSVCNGADKRQPICPSGTFMNEGDAYCQKCTKGNYCRAGIVVDQCAAGYLCDEPDIRDHPEPASYECLIGYYCPKGTLAPEPCPLDSHSNKLTTKIGRQETDCIACQPGYLCEGGRKNATECPPGHYCPPMADNKIYKKELYPCELGTYMPLNLTVYQYECYDCDAGYYCNKTGLANIWGLECPLGHYCPSRTITPRPCPAGTFQNQIGAFEEDSCEGCPVGYFCDEAAVDPTECEDGYFCPYRSAMMITCEGGYFCNKDTRYQLELCPVNHYCPRGSKFPTPCDDKHTCAAGSEHQEFCPNGRYVDTRPSQYGGQNICKKCPPGTYSISDSTGCLPCPAGYLCYGGTNSNQPVNITINYGEMCPKGSYCPEGSFEPILCQPGTFNQFVMGKSIEDCTLCAAGSAQQLWGQEGCNPCGQFADAVPGSEQCTCIGKNRVYSPVDNSCRCRTGFDFKNEQSISEGTSSDTTDCIPLVLDRCDGPNEVRSPSGACKQLDDCKDECDGQQGERDTVLGVCQCVKRKTTDEICNQECRNNAPSQGFKNGKASQLTLTPAKAGQPAEDIDLNTFGDVFGKPTGSGKTRSVGMSGKGYAGSYEIPKSIKKANKDAKQKQDIQGQESKFESRRLQQEEAEIETGDFSNPSYCLQVGDNFMFAIDNPKNYPVYMKDSVLNNNKNFDYGAFEELKTEMKRKVQDGLSTGTVFTFTFTQAGNYLFQDAEDSSKLMLISVKGQGETCSDPDRYLQIMTGESLAQMGVAQDKNLIVQPNYPLLTSMLLITIGGTAFTLWMVHYCMFKGWLIKDMNEFTYRDTQQAVNIHHENERVFMERNDFVNFKSDLIDHEEDDLDKANLDIQQDLVDAGNFYLEKYNKRRNKHKKHQTIKRKKLRELLEEIESLMGVLNSDQAAMHIHWLDLAQDDGQELDKKAIKRQIEKQMDQLHKQEQQQDENYKQKKEELLQKASDRERALLEQHAAKLRDQQEQISKENNRVVDEADSLSKQLAEYAIYDNGDLKSMNNKLVYSVNQNELLEEHEREKILNQHEQRLHGIDTVLENERKKQEQELDRALKERMDRRHRMREKMYGKDMRSEEAQIDAQAEAELDKKKEVAMAKLEKEHAENKKDILQNTDLTLQRQQLQDLEALYEEKQKQAHLDIEEELAKEVEEKKAKVYNKFIGGLSQQDIIAELKKITNDNGAEHVLQQLDQEKQKQEQSLREKLQRRQKQREQAIKDEINTGIKKLEDEDLIVSHDQEVVSTEAHLRLKQRSKEEEGYDGSLPKGCVGIDKQGIPITDIKLATAADIARKEADERKEQINEARFRLNQEIDAELVAKSLMQDLAKTDAQLALLLKQNSQSQNAKLDARMQQLKARRVARIKDEKYETIVESKVETKEEELAEKQKIGEEFVKKLIKNARKSDSQEVKDKRLDIMNEFLSDKYLDELATLLSKQYLETDSKLKRTMHKYMDEMHDETTSIKRHFMIDQESLDRLKPHMNEAMYNQQLKRIKLSEANLLRQTELMITKLYAEEEAKMRRELDKKHMVEQVELRQSFVTTQAKLRMQLVGDTLIGKHEEEQEKRTLERFQQLKHTEQERRIRAIELQKKTIANEVDSELKQVYADFEDFMRRKKEEISEALNQEFSISKRLKERQEKLRKNQKMDGLTAEEQEQMLKNYENQLEQLDSAYVAEQRRQQLLMKQKMEMRQKRFIKVQQLKTELEKSTDNQLLQQQNQTKLFKEALKKKLFGRADEKVDPEDDSELLQRLRSWDEHKHDYQLILFKQKAAQAGLAELDENQIKIMIIKLQQIEKLLKELGRQKKMRNKMNVTNAQKRTRRGSQRSDFGNTATSQLKGVLKKKVFGTIEENDEGANSGDELLSNSHKNSAALNRMMTGSRLSGFMRASANSKNARFNV